MSAHAVAIGLKIPDNEAFTALSALQRLQIGVVKVERAEVWIFETGDAGADLIASLKRNETLYNPNKHTLTALDEPNPRSGEVWIENLGQGTGLHGRLGGKMMPGVRSARRFVAWRLYDSTGAPAEASTLRTAAEVLLCNPAIERAII